MFIYSYVHMFICSYIHMSIYSYVHIFICSYINMFICSYIHMFPRRRYHTARCTRASAQRGRSCSRSPRPLLGPATARLGGCSGRRASQGLPAPQPRACVKIIILNTKIIIFNAKSIIFNAKSIIFNAKFINFNANRYLRQRRLHFKSFLNTKFIVF